jgi:hypothetical protein
MLLRPKNFFKQIVKFVFVVSIMTPIKFCTVISVIQVFIWLVMDYKKYQNKKPITVIAVVIRKKKTLRDLSVSYVIKLSSRSKKLTDIFIMSLALCSSTLVKIL